MHIFDQIRQAGAHSGAHGLLGLGELNLKHEIQLWWEHFAAVEHADEARVHQHVPLLPGCTGCAQPPASTERPSQCICVHQSLGFSREYMKHDLP